MPKWFAGAVLSAFTASAAVASVDAQKFWDSRCSECHGDAGAFARRHLGVDGDALAGRRRPTDFKRFLTLHEAGGGAADSMYALLLAQVQKSTPTLAVYQQKCERCHETAGEFVRTSLTVRDGVVIGRGNQRPIAEFLQRHGKLTAAEIPVVVESLTQALKEAAAPAK